MSLLNTTFKQNSSGLFNNIAFKSVKIPAMHKSMERLYEAAKRLKDVDGQSALARLLGESPQTVKNWEARGVSKQGMIKAEEMIGCSTTWLRTGEESQYDKTVMEPWANAVIPLELIASRAGGTKPDRSLLVLDAAQRRQAREVSITQDDIKFEMIEGVKASEFAYKYIARGVGMMPKIQDGDKLLIDPALNPKDSDTVLVEIGGDQKLMIYEVVAGEPWLTFTNPAYVDFKRPLADALMLGVALGILRGITPLRSE